MKLEVGMYTRFDYHRVNVPIQIAKIKEKYYDDIENYYYYITDTGLVVTEDNLVKEPSFDSIDLIEEGDYVNGMRVNNIAIEDGLIFLHMDADECLHEDTMLTGDDIKSIVTKEQFESMSYKVGE